MSLQLNKISSIRTLALVAKDLGEDEEWLFDIADMEPEDGLICISPRGTVLRDLDWWVRSS